MYWGGSHVTVGILLLYLCFSQSLLQSQPIFVSFVAISAVCHVTSQSFTLTGPHTLLYHILCKVWKIVSPSQCLLGPSWAVHTEPELGHMAQPMAYSMVHPKFCIFSENKRKILRLFSGNQYQYYCTKENLSSRVLDCGRFPETEEQSWLLT